MGGLLRVVDGAVNSLQAFKISKGSRGNSLGPSLVFSTNSSSHIGSSPQTRRGRILGGRRWHCFFIIIDQLYRINELQTRRVQSRSATDRLPACTRRKTRPVPRGPGQPIVEPTGISIVDAISDLFMIRKQLASVAGPAVSMLPGS